MFVGEALRDLGRCTPSTCASRRPALVGLGSTFLRFAFFLGHFGRGKDNRIFVDIGGGCWQAYVSLRLAGDVRDVLAPGPDPLITVHSLADTADHRVLLIRSVDQHGRPIQRRL